MEDREGMEMNEWVGLLMEKLTTTKGGNIYYDCMHTFDQSEGWTLGLLPSVAGTSKFWYSINCYMNSYFEASLWYNLRR